MGDQARIVFHSPSGSRVSPIVYLHSHGNFAVCLIEQAMKKLRTEDECYSCARFIGECHIFLDDDNRGLGVFNLPHSDRAPGETDQDAYGRQMKYLQAVPWEARGMFLVDVDRWQITHAGSCTNAYGDAGDGFGMQADTELTSVDGVVQIPSALWPADD